MSLLTPDKPQHRPCFSAAAAERIAHQLYLVNGNVRELTSERDQNFLITTQTGDQFVLKIAASAEQRLTLEFQNAVMAHLGASSPFGLYSSTS